LRHASSCRSGRCSASSTAPTRGRPWSSAGVRSELRRLAAQARVRRRFAPHQLRHAHAVELAREGVPLNIIQRELGHANLGTTSIYLQGIDTEEIIAAVHTRRAPMMSATAGLQLLTYAPAAGASPRASRAFAADRPTRSLVVRSRRAPDRYSGARIWA
jgi:integrase/recombinase XerD